MELWPDCTETTGFFFCPPGRIQVQELFSRLAEKDRDSDSLVVWLGPTWLASWKLPYLSNEKRAPGGLGCIGDEILPNYIWGIFSQAKYKDPD